LGLITQKLHRKEYGYAKDKLAKQDRKATYQVVLFGDRKLAPKLMTE
jgi:hypothetical protein